MSFSASAETFEQWRDEARRSLTRPDHMPWRRQAARQRWLGHPVWTEKSGLPTAPSPVQPIVPACVSPASLWPVYQNQGSPRSPNPFLLSLVTPSTLRSTDQRGRFGSAFFP